MKLTLKALASSALCLLPGFTLLQTSQSTALAANTTITNGNSTLTVDLTGTTGINNWSVNGCNQLDQEAFFYRLGGSGPALSITTISAPTFSQSPGSLTTTYANSSVSVQIIYTLTGGSPGNSALGI